jgi:hypothetical protein
MVAVRKLFENITISTLKKRVAELKLENFWINYHIRDEKAVILIKHQNRGVLSEDLIFEFPSMQRKAVIFDVRYKMPHNRNNLTYYTIRDGTVVYLYHFNDEWYMASNKNVNIGDSKVRSHKIRDLFDEAAGLTIYEKLNKDEFYSFGFTNTKIHHSFDGNHFWFNDVSSPLEGIEPLEAAPLTAVTDSYAENFYGTIAIDQWGVRYVQNSIMFSELRFLKYTKTVNKIIKNNNYDYRFYIAIRAITLSEDLYMKLKYFDSDPEYYEKFETNFADTMKLIGDKKMDLSVYSNLPGYSALLEKDLTKIFVSKNLEILYHIFYSTFQK